MSFSSGLEKFFTWLNPSILVDGTKWDSVWLAQDRSAFRVSALIAFSLVAVVTVLHYFFYDIPMGLEPRERWFEFRFGVASLASLAFLFYLSPRFVNWRHYKVPAIGALLMVSCSQGLAMLWHGQQTWIFGYILVVGSVIVLRLSPLGCLLFSIAAMSGLTPLYLEADLSVPNVVTGSMVSVAIALLARSSTLSDVRNFLLTQQNVEAQKQIADLSSELADRTKAFVPKEIAHRVDVSMNVDRRSVIDAYIEVLRPIRKDVTCLFSDIRGYTRNSEDLSAFVGESVFPELKACSNAVEEFHGIPRKVGDLIFAYFDDDDQQLNDKRALQAAFEIARVNRDFNKTSSSRQIKRYILISSGEAVVGNIGGFDSSIEITALGPPVNFLSRLDEATKVDKLACRLSPGDIIVSHGFFARNRSLTYLEHEELDLDDVNIVIRDFSLERKVVRIPCSEENYTKVLGVVDRD